MKRPAILACATAISIASACVSTPPTGLPSTLSPLPSETETPELVWIPQAIDPAPGAAVTGAIANALGRPQDQVVGAVFLFHHPAGNGAGVWVFRVGGVTSKEAVERWAASEQKCSSPPEHASLGGLETVMIRLRFNDQCQPQYLVLLDDETVAVITDDGAYAGNVSGTPTVPYRPASEFASLVTWLRNELKTVDLQPGGPPPVQG